MRRTSLLSGCGKSSTLGRRFAEFNNAYFEGRLPKYEVYLCKHAARYAPESYGECLRGQKRIRIRQSLSQKETRATLLHEMIHILIPYHGIRFQKECRRLRKLSAPMSDREFDTGPIWKPPSLTERNAQILIEEALLDKLPMRSVRRYLEVEFMRPISEIEEKIDLRKLVKKSRLPEADIQLRKFKTST